MPIFSHQSASIHYSTCGRGEPVVLIHGLGLTGAEWALQVPALQSRFRLIIPDLPGFGGSSAPSSQCSIAVCADILWGLLDQVGASAANLVGFSLGGAVALEMAAQRPQQVPRLALINSLANYHLDHWRKWFEARFTETLVRMLGMREAAAFGAVRLFPHPWQLALRQRASKVVGSTDVSVYLGMGQALQKWTAADRLDKIISRALVIAAEHDFTPLEEKREMARRLRAPMVVVRGSRHATPFDSVETTNACLLALLTDAPLPPEDRWTCDSPNNPTLLEQLIEGERA
jgi:3-oxoadipate enol-lactonase